MNKLVFFRILYLFLKMYMMIDDLSVERYIQVQVNMLITTEKTST